MIPRIPSWLSRNRRLLFCTTLLLPTLSWAADWNTTTGDFNVPANWNPVGVPSAVNTFITNGGTANILNLDNFAVNDFFLGGHSGIGSVNQTGGTLSVGKLVIGGDDGNGGTGVGTYTISGGTLSAGGAEHWIGSKGGTGNLIMTGGTFNANNWIILGRDGGGVGNATLSGNAAINKTGGNHIGIGLASGTTSTMTMSGSSTMTSNNEIRVGWLVSGTKGILNMNDNTITTASNVIFGQQAASGEGTLNNSAKIVANNELWVGSDGGSGSLVANTQSQINVTNGFVVGRFNSTGTYTANGQSATTVGGFFVIGDGATSTGTTIVNDAATITAGQQVWIGVNDAAAATLTVNGGTVLAHASTSGGNADPTGAGLRFRTVNGVVNLNGGKLITPGFNKSSGNGTINLNGGTIEVSDSIPEFFAGFSSGNVVIQGGGAKLDTAGNAVTTAVPLTGAGSFTKLGAGQASLNGNNTYTGNTIIQQGTLSFSFASINDASSVYIANDGFLNLNTSGQTDVITSLYFDGIAQAVGIWGASGSGAQFESPFITGNGFLSVTAVPEPGTIGLLIVSAMGFALIRRSRAGISH